MRKIFWTEEEKDIIINHGIKLLERHPRMSWLDLCRKAQEIAINNKELDHERKREFKTNIQIEWFIKNVTKQKEHKPKETIITIEKTLNDFATDQIITHLYRKHLEPKLKETITNTISEILKGFKPTVTPIITKPTKPKILIIGMLPNQFVIIQKEYEQHFELKGAHEITGTNRNIADTADKVIMLTKFVSHSTQNMIPKEKLIYADGGITNVRSTLEKLRRQS